MAADGALTKALNEIWAAELPLAEKRRLATRVAVASTMGGRDEAEQQVEKAADSSHIHMLEEALVATSRLVGGTAGKALPISEAKRVLRLRGPHGASLASRLGRLSKARNVSAGHPHVRA